jgi:hypothetical protein
MPEITKPEITKRIFLIGCPRSGTTIAQVMLAGHPEILSFPETQFFKWAVGLHRRPQLRLGLATGHERRAFHRCMEERLDRPDLKDRLPRQPLLFRTAVNAYISVLDELAQDGGKGIWLEKTPLHVHFTDLIEKYVPQAHFIHVVRRGCDVVASIRDRALRFSDRFGGQKDPEVGVLRWNSALRDTRRCLGRERHTVVLYETLVEQPDRVLSMICDRLGLAYDPAMKAVGGRSESIVETELQWLSGATGELHVPRSKFAQLFDEPTQAKILERLDFGTYEEVRKLAEASLEQADRSLEVGAGQGR